ncbi:hypothetical protein [Ensifer sp. ZNC0028]|uniref:hypothetical protein n=1 Tax=Ensifer sp. ZNC0028 TaxID=1339236 RepID=UPI0005BA4937|nr:hypothetical protein [Ensifer sp. ZNC0028]
MADAYRKQTTGSGPTIAAGLDYGRIASVYICFGLLSLFTAWVFSWESQKIFTGPARMAASSPAAVEADEAGERVPTQNYELIGPFMVTRANQVFRVQVTADVQVNRWSFVEVELLDAEKDYMLSFGQELWHEIGADSDGPWEEADEIYEMKLTIPQPGAYYLNVKAQGPVRANVIRVAISRSYGSSIPHLIFGVLTLSIGLLVNEIVNRTIIRLAKRFRS